MNKLMMVSINVADMAKSKKFYAEKLGFKIATEYRMDDDNWWTTLAPSEGGTNLTLSRAKQSPEPIQAGTLAIYFETDDVEAAHKELSGKGVKLNPVTDDLFGPGSGVKFFNFADPDGTMVHYAQKHPARAPF